MTDPLVEQAGVFGSWPDGCSDPLTQEEVDALPDGAEVVIVWSGGNGPHRYRIVREAGLVYARSLHIKRFDTRWQDRISFVGARPPFTVVRRVHP